MSNFKTIKLKEDSIELIKSLQSSYEKEMGYKLSLSDVIIKLSKDGGFHELDVISSELQDVKHEYEESNGIALSLPQVVKLLKNETRGNIRFTDYREMYKGEQGFLPSVSDTISHMIMKAKSNENSNDFSDIDF